MSFYCPGCGRKYRYTHEGYAVCLTHGCDGWPKPEPALDKLPEPCGNCKMSEISSRLCPKCGAPGIAYDFDPFAPAEPLERK